MSVALAEPNEAGHELLPLASDVSVLNVPRGLPRRAGLKERAVVAAAAVLNDVLGPREKRAFGVLMYHRVASPPPNWPKPTWNVPPWRFERQLEGLLARGWRPCALSQVMECLRRDLPIPRKTFVVTFDDGYANVLHQAYPILTRLSIPATVFLATAYIDSNQPFPCDDWSVAGQPGVPSDCWRPLTTEECRRLTANGLIELGAHTHTHADFRGRPEEFAEDLRQNVTILRAWFQVEKPAFALPYGTKADGFASDELAGAARAAGASCCLTTEGTVVRLGDSPFDWGRFAAEEHDTARTLAARLGGWQEALRGLKRGGK
jgi:peptidoglycan/xylan/chitin deacetylase (PgdA/CDA1 family)